MNGNSSGHTPSVDDSIVAYRARRLFELSDEDESALGRFKTYVRNEGRALWTRMVHSDCDAESLLHAIIYALRRTAEWQNPKANWVREFAEIRSLVAALAEKLDTFDNSDYFEAILLSSGRLRPLKQAVDQFQWQERAESAYAEASRPPTRGQRAARIPELIFRFELSQFLEREFHGAQDEAVADIRNLYFSRDPDDVMTTEQVRAARNGWHARAGVQRSALT